MEQILKIEKADTTGWKVTTKDGYVVYIGEYSTHAGCFCNEGVTYKDRHAFETGEGVCYIPEYGFENAEENNGPLYDFEAKEMAASDIMNNNYQSESGYTRQELIDICNGCVTWAEDLFDHLDWMCPETLADEDAEDSEENNNWIEGNLAYEQVYLPQFKENPKYQGKTPVNISDFMDNHWRTQCFRNRYIDGLVEKGIITAKRAEEIKYTEED